MYVSSLHSCSASRFSPTLTLLNLTLTVNHLDSHPHSVTVYIPMHACLHQSQVPDGIRHNILEMVDWCEQGEFVKAHEVYLRTAIGNAPWPIGACCM